MMLTLVGNQILVQAFVCAGNSPDAAHERGKILLRNVPIFEGLTDEDIGYLTARAATRTYPKGAIIVNEGDEGNSLYLIQSGSVKTYLSDEKGKEVVLSSQGPGEYFGELALFDEAPRSASVAAWEVCKVMIVSKATLRGALNERPQIAAVLLKQLAGRVRTLTESVRILALFDVFGRLVALLNKLGKPGENGFQIIEQKLTQQDLASRIGASREMVGRILHDLVEGGYIELDQKRIIIKKKIPSSW
jgi:CRP/FNR family cyclic AMP-dependent transcriptional regulator